MRALYDLGRYLTSFNFFEWLVQAHANGATVVVFDIRTMRGDKWPLAIAGRRFASICKPGPALIGLPHEVFAPGNERPTEARELAKPGGAGIVAFCRAGRKFKRLAVPQGHTGKGLQAAQYTVTLRKTQRAPGRDSDEAVWRKFAQEIGALVIPDYDERPIHLHDRMWLYSKAEMNFFVSNGPGILCSMSDYPCMMFNTHHAVNSLLADGMQEYEQYPWMKAENQRAIWEEATLVNLREHFYHWRDSGGFLDRPPTPAAA